jgi:hypothetical protein
MHCTTPRMTMRAMWDPYDKQTASAMTEGIENIDNDLQKLQSANFIETLALQLSRCESELCESELCSQLAKAVQQPRDKLKKLSEDASNLQKEMQTAETKILKLTAEKQAAEASLQEQIEELTAGKEQAEKEAHRVQVCHDKVLGEKEYIVGELQKIMEEYENKICLVEQRNKELVQRMADAELKMQLSERFPLLSARQPELRDLTAGLDNFCMEMHKLQESQETAAEDEVRCKIEEEVMQIGRSLTQKEDLEAMKQDLEEVPMGNMIDFQQQLEKQNADLAVTWSVSSSEMGLIIGNLNDRVNVFKDKYDADTPVPHDKEDAIAGEMIQKYFREPMAELEERNIGAYILSDNLSKEEGAKIANIKKSSEFLNSPDARIGRSTIEKERNRKMMNLAEYFISATESVSKRASPTRFLEETLQKFQNEFETLLSEYDRKRVGHDVMKEATDSQLTAMAIFVDVKCREHQKKTQEVRWVELTMRLQQRRLVHGIFWYLEQLQCSMHCIRSARVDLHSALTSYDQADQTRNAMAPALTDEADTHERSSRRTRVAHELLMDFKDILSSSYADLIQKSKMDVQRFEAKLPEYELKFHAIHQCFTSDVDMQINKLEELSGQVMQKHEEAQDDLEELSYAEYDGWKSRFEEKEKTVKDCEAKFLAYQEQVHGLNRQKREMDQLAEKIGAPRIEAPEDSHFNVQEWLKSFHFRDGCRPRARLALVDELGRMRRGPKVFSLTDGSPSEDAGQTIKSFSIYGDDARVQTIHESEDSETE